MIPKLQYLTVIIKRRGVNSKRTLYQLQFIIDCMEIGAESKEHKMSPSFACRLMKKIGTIEGHKISPYPFTVPSSKGYPYFSKKDTLDLMQIKGYFGQQIPQLKKALIKMKSKSFEIVNTDTPMGDEEEETMY